MKSQLTLDEVVAKAGADAQAALGGGAAVYVFVTRGPLMASGLNCDGNYSIDTVIGCIVQLLGDLRVRILKAAEDQAAQAAKESRGQSPTGN